MYFIMIMDKIVTTNVGPVCFDTEDDAAACVEERFPGATVEYHEDWEAFIARTDTISLARTEGDGSEQVPL